MLASEMLTLTLGDFREARQGARGERAWFAGRPAKRGRTDRSKISRC